MFSLSHLMYYQVCSRDFQNAFEHLCYFFFIYYELFIVVYHHIGLWFKILFNRPTNFKEFRKMNLGDLNVLCMYIDVVAQWETREKCYTDHTIMIEV